MFFWKFIFHVLLCIPIIIFVWQKFAPIRWNLRLANKNFQYYVLGYIAIAFICIGLSVIAQQSPSAPASTVNNSSVWSHLFSPGSSINDEDDHVYFRLIDVLGELIFNVLLITILINSLSRLRENWKEGKLYYNRALYGTNCEKYVIVILGNHDSLFEIVRQCFKRTRNKPDYILVMIDGEVDEYRSKLSSIITQSDMKKIVLCRGSLVSRLDLNAIHIEKASEVFILGNKINSGSSESLHDAECIKCMQLLRGNGAKDKGIVTASSRPEQCSDPMICRVFFEYQTSYSVFQTADIGGDEVRPISDKEDGLPKRILVFKPMSFYEICCEKVIACPELPDDNYYIPLDGKDGINKDSDQFVHLIIVGQTKMGTAMGIETAQLAHFPNFHKVKNKKRVGPRTRITFIDEHADTEKDYFMGRLDKLFEVSPWRYRDLSVTYTNANWIDPMKDASSPYHDGHIGFDFIDVEWEFIKGNIASRPIRKYLNDSVSEKNAKCTIAICFDDQNMSVAAAQYLPDAVCENAQEILIYQNREGSVIDEMVNYDESGHFAKFRSFGTIGKYYDDKFSDKIELSLDPILAKKKAEKSKSQIACWWSDRYRELTTWIKLRSFKDIYDENNITLFQKVEHSRWNMEQLILGYRPLTTDEQDSVIAKGSEAKKDAKNALKAQKAHLDICSHGRLCVIDQEVIKYDTPKEQKIMAEEYEEYKKQLLSSSN